MGARSFIGADASRDPRNVGSRRLAAPSQPLRSGVDVERARSSRSVLGPIARHPMGHRAAARAGALPRGGHVRLAADLEAVGNDRGVHARSSSPRMGRYACRASGDLVEGEAERGAASLLLAEAPPPKG